jgi:hypothetical protein
MGGWTNRQKNGVAASKPTAKSDQPSALTAKPIRKGMFPSVRFSIGTLKHASMVQYLSERRSSRLRNAFNWRATSRTGNAQAQGVEITKEPVGPTVEVELRPEDEQTVDQVTKNRQLQKILGWPEIFRCL